MVQRDMGLRLSSSKVSRVSDPTRPAQTLSQLCAERLACRASQPDTAYSIGIYRALRGARILPLRQLSQLGQRDASGPAESGPFLPTPLQLTCPEGGLPPLHLVMRRRGGSHLRLHRCIDAECLMRAAQVKAQYVLTSNLSVAMGTSVAGGRVYASTGCYTHLVNTNNCP